MSIVDMSKIDVSICPVKWWKFARIVRESVAAWTLPRPTPIILTQSLPRSPGFCLKVPGAGFELIGDAPVTGPDGRFELAVLSGYRYDVDAELVGKSGDTPRVRQSDWVPLSGSSDASITLIIRR
jgi:hypothetical protein